MPMYQNAKSHLSSTKDHREDVFLVHVLIGGQAETLSKSSVL